MNRVVLLLGGNLGDRLSLIHKAINSLKKHFIVNQSSAIYESTAWGENSEGNYLNMAVIISTDMLPLDILQKVNEIEDHLERKRERKWGNRTMDIDIIYIEELVINEDNLTVPHPFIAARRFVLIPLCELLPAFVHPRLGKTNAQLLEACPDSGDVWEYDSNI